jgi:hypothetical protein
MMEWLDSLWAWVMSILASFLSLFTVEAQACASQTHPPLMDLLGAVASNAPESSDKAAEVFEALAAQVPPMLVELSEGDAPPNM